MILKLKKKKNWLYIIKIILNLLFSEWFFKLLNGIMGLKISLLSNNNIDPYDYNSWNTGYGKIS